MLMLNWSDSESTDVISTCVDLLEAGELIVYPTDTLYGLGADATSSAAVTHLQRLKGRDGSPISIMLADPDQVLEQLVSPDEAISELVNRFLPGAVTLIANIRMKVAPELMGRNGTVGLRVPDHPFCRRIVSTLGKPVTTTSVNPTGMSAASSPEEAAAYFPTGIGAVVDDGPIHRNSVSTVIDTTSRPMSILREGMVPASDLEWILN